MSAMVALLTPTTIAWVEGLTPGTRHVDTHTGFLSGGGMR
jgi:hypothetical protein